MSTFNLYEALGVDSGASFAEIKAAYRRLANKYHPDKKGGDEDMFKAAKQAYEVLSDESNRAYYDKHGKGMPNKADINKLAIAEIIGLVQAWINSNSFHINLIEFVDEHLEKKNDQVLAGYEDAKMKRIKLIEMKKKVVCDKENFIAEFFDQAINDLDEFLLGSENNQKTMLEALTLIDTFSWDADEGQTYLLQTTSTTGSFF